MPKYSLTKKDKSYLTVEINGKTYNIPLATTLKLKEVRKFMKLGKKTEEEQTTSVAEIVKEIKAYQAEIDKLEKTKLNVKDFSRKSEEYMPFAIWAMVCLLLEVLLRLTVLRRIP